MLCLLLHAPILPRHPLLLLLLLLLLRHPLLLLLHALSQGGQGAPSCGPHTRQAVVRGGGGC